MTILLICICSTAITRQARADSDVMDTVLDILKGLTCTTEGIGDLLRTDFAHTCTPTALSTIAIGAIISPGLYVDTMLKLKINDDLLFPKACQRSNRIDPNQDLALDFALCNEGLLRLVRIEMVAQATIAIASAAFTGDTDGLWDKIKDAIIVPPEKFHVKYHNQPGDWGVMLDPYAQYLMIPWKVIQNNDALCVSTLGFTGWLPVGCKYIKEPYPESMYAGFFSPTASGDGDTYKLLSCGSTDGCYHRAQASSKTGLVITGPLIECIREMATKLMFGANVCGFNNVQQVVNSASRESSTFFQFQKNMHKAVTALLTIYVVLYGLKILLAGNVPPKSEMINFLLKFLFVIYFSVGINTGGSNASDYTRLDGMIQWAFPMLLGGMQQLAQWVMNASPSELCKFDVSEYPANLAHLALWDALDCKVSHYLGLDMIQTMVIDNASRNHDFSSFDVLSFPIPPYIYLLIPALFSGNLTLISLAAMYPLLVISVAGYLVNATVICMISIVILSILAPLFVPMFLFEYTRGYFDSWVKLLISFMLQPMVVVTFMTIMFAVYDVGFYGQCKYKFSSIASDGRTTKIFYLDNDWSNYTKEDSDSCKKSLGFMLNNPFATMYDYSATTVKDAFGTDNKAASVAFLAGIVAMPGLIFISPSTVFEKVKEIVLSLLTACFSLYLMYHLSGRLSEFAADITEGVSVSGVSIGAQTIFKNGMAAINKAGGALNKAGGAPKAGASKQEGDQDNKNDEQKGNRDKLPVNKSDNAQKNSDNHNIISDSKQDKGDAV